MRPTFFAAVLVSSVAALSGCGSAPRLDASDPGSLAKLGAALDERGKKQLQVDIMALTVPGMLASMRPGAARPEPSSLLAPIDGLTAAEIHTRAESARASRR